MDTTKNLSPPCGIRGTRNGLDVDEQRRPPARDLEQAYQRGQYDALVRTIQEQLQQLNMSMRSLQQDLQQVREGRVTREEFSALTIKVEGLSKWQWTIAGGLGLLMVLTQIIPRVVDVVKK